MTEVCPHCGQRVLVRYGVKLGPKGADLFDMIERATKRGGIMPEVLIGVFYPGKPKKVALNALAAEIWWVNSLLTETSYRIRGERFGPYRVVTEAA